RHLTNFGFKADLAYAQGKHNLKFGTQMMGTRLSEEFTAGITAFDFNPVCLDRTGNAIPAPTITNPANCARAGFLPNPDLQPALVAIDLTRGGKLFDFNAGGTPKEYAGYIQDSITLGNLTLSAGLRIARYDGLSHATGVQPRSGRWRLLVEIHAQCVRVRRAFEYSYHLSDPVAQRQARWFRHPREHN